LPTIAENASGCFLLVIPAVFECSLKVIGLNKSGAYTWLQKLYVSKQ
jgi:hypothetical protein